MDKYHYKFAIVTGPDSSNWSVSDHKGKVVASGTCYKNWHNAKRAMDRHISVIQSGNFTLPAKPLRKEYTFKTNKEKIK